MLPVCGIFFCNLLVLTPPPRPGAEVRGRLEAGPRGGVRGQQGQRGQQEDLRGPQETGASLEARPTDGRESRYQAGTKDILERGLETLARDLEIGLVIRNPGRKSRNTARESRNTARKSRNTAWLSEICLPAKTVVEYFLLSLYFAFLCRKQPRGV